MSAVKSAEANALETEMAAIGANARAATHVLAVTPAIQKRRAIEAAADALAAARQTIIQANEKDMAQARDAKLNAAMLDRLALDGERVDGMIQGLRDVAVLDDPVGRVLDERTRPNGLRIQRVSVPVGVIGIIYESRPNVTADAGALCVMSGNAAILRCGSESFNSSHAIAACLRSGLKSADLPEDCIQIIPTTDRAAVGILLAMDGDVDIIVPRGGRSLIERVKEESRIPVLAHLDGICHVYVHGAADPDTARDVTFNAKMRRTGICGATETLLIDRQALKMLPDILAPLFEVGCEVRGDAEILALESGVVPASEIDWDTEYLDAIISVRVVDGLDQAIAHVNLHGSHHTDAILTQDDAAAERFLNEVDSAIVLHNASTQYADGGEFGMGAEIGISNGKLHARGPVGVEQLTTYKYKVFGTGQVRP